MNHDITVHYTQDDDGIWLGCECGWEGQVPGYEFWPTVQQLHALSHDHLLGVT